MFNSRKLEAIEWEKIKGQLEALKIIVYDSNEGLTSRYQRIVVTINDFIEKIEDDINY